MLSFLGERSNANLLLEKCINAKFVRIIILQENAKFLGERNDFA